MAANYNFELGGRRMQLLTENDIVEAVCGFLELHDYEIEWRLTTTQRGVDIVARKESRPVRELYVEAKGATSAAENSRRYGQPFSSSQVFSHVAKAFYTAAVATARAAGDVEARSAIALPDDDFHRKFVSPVQPALNALEIGVLWVDAASQVQFEATWAA